MGVDPRGETGALINRGEVMPLFLDVVIVNRFTFPLSRMSITALNQYISADKSIKSLTAQSRISLCVQVRVCNSGAAKADFNGHNSN